jgi:hypothetical protein
MNQNDKHLKIKFIIRRISNFKYLNTDLKQVFNSYEMGMIVLEKFMINKSGIMSGNLTVKAKRQKGNSNQECMTSITSFFTHFYI